MMGFDPVSYAMGAKSGGGGGSTGGGVLVVGVDWETAGGTLDKTWQEIADADYAILKVPLDGGNASASIFFCQQAAVGYGVGFISYEPGQSAAAQLLFVATSADGYPVYTEG